MIFHDFTKSLVFYCPCMRQCIALVLKSTKLKLKMGSAFRGLKEHSNRSSVTHTHTHAHTRTHTHTHRYKNSSALVTHSLQDGLAVSPGEHLQGRECLLRHVHALDHLQLLYQDRDCRGNHHCGPRESLHHVGQGTTRVHHLGGRRGEGRWTRGEKRN